MRGTRLVLVGVLLIAPAVFAQRSGGFRGGGPPIGRSGSGRFGHRLGYGRGYGYGSPYLPLWDYGLNEPWPLADAQGSVPYEDQYAGEPQYEYPPVPPFAAQAAPPPPKPANPVIHEYNFEKEPALASGEQKSFTIVLKDGSTRSATMSWVQDGKLYYLDSRSLQQSLSPGMIDRDATERANAQKNLRMGLPPG